MYACTHVLVYITQDKNSPHEMRHWYFSGQGEPARARPKTEDNDTTNEDDSKVEDVDVEIYD